MDVSPSERPPSPVKIKTRPYWHVDAKWITGLVLLGVLGAALIVYSLVTITAQEPAVELLSTTLAAALSPGSLDDTTDFDAIVAELRDTPGQKKQIIPGLDIWVSLEEIEDLSPREARLFFMSKLAEPAYENGIQGLAALATDPEMAAQIEEGGGIFDLITRANHQKLTTLLVLLVTVGSGLTLLLVFFSYRHGRLFSPGCVFFLAGLPGLALSGLLTVAGQTNPAVAPSRDAGTTALLIYLASLTLPIIAQLVLQMFIIVVAAGVILMLLGTFFALFKRPS